MLFYRAAGFCQKTGLDPTLISSTTRHDNTPIESQSDQQKLDSTKPSPCPVEQPLPNKGSLPVEHRYPSP